MVTVVRVVAMTQVGVSVSVILMTTLTIRVSRVEMLLLVGGYYVDFRHILR